MHAQMYQRAQYAERQTAPDAGGASYSANGEPRSCRPEEQVCSQPDQAGLAGDVQIPNGSAQRGSL